MTRQPADGSPSDAASPTYRQVLGDLRAAYDAKADERDAGSIAAWKAGERARFLAELKRTGAARLLEIGSGPGRDGRFFTDEGLAVVCTDPSPAMVERCRAKGLEAHVMDVLRLDFPPDSFDAAYALNSLLHVPKADMPSALAAIRRLLHPGGLFYMGVYGGVDAEGVYESDRYHPQRFFSRHTDATMADLVARFFEVACFRRIELGAPGRDHFQSFILRKETLRDDKPIRRSEDRNA